VVSKLRNRAARTRLYADIGQIIVEVRMMCFVVIPQHRSLSAPSGRKLTKTPAGDETITTSHYCDSCDSPTLLLSKESRDFCLCHTSHSPAERLSITDAAACGSHVTLGAFHCVIDIRQNDQLPTSSLIRFGLSRVERYVPLHRQAAPDLRVTNEGA
jgi:hypothetical protein